MSTVERLNLARRPFSNRSPRRRLRIILWTAAGILLLLNSFLFAQYWISSSSSREELRKVRESSDQQVEAMRALQNRLANVDLEVQNEQVRFLNRKIAERTFPWSDLFDDLAAVLPRNVRLLTVAPGIEDDAKNRRGAEIETSIDWIGLEISARARSSEDVLDFIDAMFEHPSFAGPTLAQENTREGEIEFNASVRYRVAPPPTPEPRDESIELTIAGDEAVGGAENGESAAPDSASTDSATPVTGRGSSTRRTSGTVASRASAAPDDGAAPRPPGATERGSAFVASGDGAPAGSAAAGNPVPEPPAESRPASPIDSRPSNPTTPTRTVAGAIPSASAPTPRAAASDAGGDDLPAAVPGSTEAIADERFGRNQLRAPRLPNASGNNGGVR